MAYEGEAIKGQDQKFGACYASAAVTASYLVAYAGFNNTGDTGDGTGFGYAVKMTVGTNTLVVGAAFSPDPTVTTYGTGESFMVVKRGVFPRLACWATCTEAFLMTPNATKVGLADDNGAATDALWHPGLAGVWLQTTVGAATSSGACFLNTWA